MSQRSLILALLLLPLTATAAPVLEYHPAGDMPFSEAVRVGDTLYLAGKLGIDPATRKLAEGGIYGETFQAMKNIQQALDQYGSSITRVAKCTVFLADMAEWAEMNRAYRSFFPRNPPARSAVEVAGLALNARVEIECIAAMK
jgi:reactive intermediate/imine deaminase